MVLVFIFFAIVIILTSIICITILSTLKIKIKNLNISNIEKPKEPEYQIIFSLCVFNKIKWLSIHFNNQKIKKMYAKAKSQKIDLKKTKKDFDFKLEDLKLIKIIAPKISYLDLQIKVGSEDVIITSFIIFIISTIISIILPHTIKKYKKDKYYYDVKPLYMNQNLYMIKFNTEIEIKISNILNVIYILIKRRLLKKYQMSNGVRDYSYG